MTDASNDESTANEFMVPDAVWAVRDDKSLRVSGPMLHNAHSERDGYLLGVFGLSGAFAFVCLIIAGVITLSTKFNLTPPAGSAPFLINLLIGSFFCVLAFAAVSPTLYQQNVIVRFLWGIGTLIPGCVLFLGIISQITFGPPARVMVDLPLSVFACFLAITCVSLGIELWTPWALSTDSATTPQVRRTGIRSLAELMVISAVSMAVFSVFGSQTELMPLFVFAGFGFCSAIVVSVFLLGCLQRDIRLRSLALILIVCAAVVSMLTTCLVVSLEYGIGGITAFPVKSLGLFLFGLLQYTGISAGILTWLRYCGWSSTNHRRVSNRSETVSGPPAS